jgi:transaldolase/glucose-6-phosphate isomerase
VTTNPAIFNKAISGSDAYDTQITQLVQEGCSIQEIYERLVVTDVQSACDILRPVYDASDGVDGFVSLEVSPYLAHDTEGTKQEARRLFEAVNRPNVMIKIPGTPAGLPAIQEMLYEGININVTLLFSVEVYEAVAQAYIEALERRVAAGLPIDRVASVASFFLSRIDVLVDQLLGHRIRPGCSDDHGPHPQKLAGQVAIASARLAYQRFKTLFDSSRWQALETYAPRVQRPLWASTSTKNPLYSDVYYVEPLIARHTVNTLPDDTVAAFTDHGDVQADRIECDIDGARETMHALKQVGIDLQTVTQYLLDDGVQKFIEPFDVLMRTLAIKRQAVRSSSGVAQTLSCGDLQASVSATANSLDTFRFTRRLWAADPTLWHTDTVHRSAIQQRLGWLTCIDDFKVKVDEITAFATQMKMAGLRHVVLLGMGGSSLCAEVCRATFGVAPGWLDLTILDNTDPMAVRHLEAQLDLSKTLFLVASKSGTTTETLSFYRYFFDRIAQDVSDQPGDHFVAITDPGSFLTREAASQQFRACFENPETIGGRFSALSYFGLLPMALLGIDIGELLARAEQLRLSSDSFIPVNANTAVSLGTALGVAARHGRDKITFVMSDALRAFGDWVEQLLAESTGKEGVGLTPIVGEALAAPEGYSKDRVFVSLRIADQRNEVHDNQLRALEALGHPVLRIVMQDVLDLGAEFLRWELATATAGAVMRLNPFDEPNVAESKSNTNEILQVWQQQGHFGEPEPVLKAGEMSIFSSPSSPLHETLDVTSLAGCLNSLADSAVAPDYIALLAYLTPTAERQQTLQLIRGKLQERRWVATTLGYGPRYLHSTGQLHKGGPPNGIYLILTCDAPQDLPIPGMPYGFATLQRAQALGDFRALNARARRVMRLHLGADVDSGLQQFLAALQ